MGTRILFFFVSGRFRNPIRCLTVIFTWSMQYWIMIHEDGTKPKPPGPFKRQRLEPPILSVENAVPKILVSTRT